MPALLVVAPEGTLFRSGAFAEVKKTLIDDFHLFAVVSLPPGTFAPYSDVKTALLFFKRPDNVVQSNPKARQETWYYEMALPMACRNSLKADQFRIKILPKLVRCGSNGRLIWGVNVHSLLSMLQIGVIAGRFITCGKIIALIKLNVSNWNP